MLDVTTSLLTVSDAYRRATGLADATVSARVFRDGKRISALRSGSELRRRTAEHALRWFSAHWPEGAEWPASVPRPAPDALIVSGPARGVPGNRAGALPS